jgi:hypothetical protein
MYRGIVIAESLQDWFWINQVRIFAARITISPNDSNSLWYLYKVEAAEDRWTKFKYFVDIFFPFQKYRSCMSPHPYPAPSRGGEDRGQSVLERVML